MTEMNPEKPIAGALSPEETPFELPMAPAAFVVRASITPIEGADPIVMEAGRREPGETLLASTRTLIIAADSKLVEAGVDSMVIPLAVKGRMLNPLKNIGRFAAKRFSANEPLQSSQYVSEVPLFDPLTGRITLLEAVRWTEGVGYQDPTLIVTDKSRGMTSLSRVGLTGQKLEIDPKAGVVKRATVRPTTISPEVVSTRPSDPANLLHTSAVLDRSHLLPPADYLATQSFRASTVDDVRRIVGIEWQPPQPPDRSWQPADWPRQ